MDARFWTLGVLLTAALITERGAGQETACSELPNLPEKRLAVVDAGATDPSFKAFRRQLAAAALTCDMAGIQRMLAADVELPDETQGTENFTRFYAESWARLDLCQLLLQATTLPALGSLERGFCAPYMRCPDTWMSLPDAFDPVWTAVVIGEQVPVRQRPEPRAPVVAMLSDHLVQELSPCEPLWPWKSGWVLVAGAGGLLGYVEEAHVLTVRGLSAFFTKREGQWRLQSIQGDL